MNIFELQDERPLPADRKVILDDGREGVLVWEYEPRGAEGAAHKEADRLRGSVIYMHGNRRRFVTLFFPLDWTEEILRAYESLIIHAAEEVAQQESASLDS